MVWPGKWGGGASGHGAMHYMMSKCTVSLNPLHACVVIPVCGDYHCMFLITQDSQCGCVCAIQI